MNFESASPVALPDLNMTARKLHLDLDCRYDTDNLEQPYALAVSVRMIRQGRCPDPVM